MSGQEAKAPSLQFPSFAGRAGKWTCNGLRNWLTVSDVENRDGKFTTEDVLSVSGDYGVVNQIEFKGRSFAGASLEHYRILNKHQVVYTKSPLKLAPFGIIKANLSQDGIVSALYGIYDVTDADPSFIQYYFESIPRLNNYLRPLVNKGAKNTLLVSDGDAILGEVCFPDIREQQKIGSFFCSLDALIAGREKSLEKLEALKKSMLLKMFPQGDAKVPEVRFGGFEEDWGKKRLGEIANYTSEKNTRMETSEAFTNSAEHGVISQLDYFDFDVAKRLAGYTLVRPDDFVYNPRISTIAPFGPINRNELGRSGAMSPLYIVFKCHGINLDYLQVYFKTSCWHRFMHLNGDSGARSDRFSIRSEVFMDMPVLAPLDEIEQQKIGSFFRSLDALIAARREEVEKLKQMKKALLERMFV